MNNHIVKKNPFLSKTLKLSIKYFFITFFCFQAQAAEKHDVIYAEALAAFNNDDCTLTKTKLNEYLSLVKPTKKTQKSIDATLEWCNKKLNALLQPVIYESTRRGVISNTSIRRGKIAQPRDIEKANKINKAPPTPKIKIPLSK
jgi:hypothetical protein